MTTFYRVAGTDGWVFDLRGENHEMMRLVSSEPTSLYSKSDSSINGWDINFVRGMAETFNLKEIALNETSRVISFQTSDKERVNIYYTTRTVGTALNHPSQGKMQLFRRNCSNEELKEIMQNPRVHTSKAYRNDQVKIVLAVNTMIQKEKMSILMKRKITAINSLNWRRKQSRLL